jgi:hypothetical protein
MKRWIFLIKYSMDFPRSLLIVLLVITGVYADEIEEYVGLTPAGGGGHGTTLTWLVSLNKDVDDDDDDDDDDG